MVEGEFGHCVGGVDVYNEQMLLRKSVLYCSIK